MNKKTFILIIIFIILGIAGFLIGTNFTTTTSKPSITPIPLASGQEKAASLKELLASGISRECTFENEGDKGVAYVTKSEARLDFDATLNNGKIFDKYHMILLGNDLFIWKNDDLRGAKVPFAVLNSSATPVPTVNPWDYSVTTGGFFSDADYQYKCVAWLPDVAKLSPPESVKFEKSGYISTPRPNIDQGEKMLNIEQ